MARDSVDTVGSQTDFHRSIEVCAAQKTDVDTPKVFNLKTAMDKFIVVFEKVYNVKVKWTDMKSEHKELTEYFATKRFHLSVDLDHIKLGKPKQKDTTRTLLYANLYENKAKEKPNVQASRTPPFAKEKTY
uniref:Putative secreted protein n=1 Tax=Ixodes ricinus TaxID=34613 RepID=A0A0K8RB13_IXORI